MHSFINIIRQLIIISLKMIFLLSPINYSREILMQCFKSNYLTLSKKTNKIKCHLSPSI